MRLSTFDSPIAPGFAHAALIMGVSMLSEPRQIVIDCAPNFRDIGGLPAADGLHVAHGRVFRSEAVLEPQALDAGRLSSHGVRLVCDLRGKGELISAPNAFWQGQGAELLELDIAADIRGNAHWEAMQADPGERGAIQLMRLTYRALPAAAAGHLAKIFTRVAGRHLPLVIHCTAGKDRTGVVIALLLAALGTPRAEILTDYLASGTRLNPQVIAATRAIMDHGLGRPVDEAALQALCGVREEYLNESFTAIEADHGSVGVYLRDAAGLDDAMTRKLRGNLLV